MVMDSRDEPQDEADFAYLGAFEFEILGAWNGIIVIENPYRQNVCNKPGNVTMAMGRRNHDGRG